jgi:hypothetical protein
MHALRERHFPEPNAARVHPVRPWIRRPEGFLQPLLAGAFRNRTRDVHLSVY